MEFYTLYSKKTIAITIVKPRDHPLWHIPTSVSVIFFFFGGGGRGKGLVATIHLSRIYQYLHY